MGDDSVAIGFGRRLSAKVRRQGFLFCQDGIDGFANLFGNGRFTDMFKEHAG